MFPALNGRRTIPAFVLLAALWGVALAAGDLTAFYLCVSLLASAFVLLDFRVGVVALILLMPLSGSSTLFPHEMFGITGLNPLNLLLVATAGSWLLHALAGDGLRRVLPHPFVWLYVVPILAAGVVGSRHIHEIPPALKVINEGIDFPSAAAYFQEMALKPLLMVIFAFLVGAAVAKSARPARFLIPAVLSMCVMALLVPLYVAHSGLDLHEIAGSDARMFLSALGLHANDLGRLYAIAFALLLFAWSEAQGVRWRWAFLVAGGLTMVALVLTFSRGAFVALAVVGVLFLVSRRSIRTLFFATLAVVAVLALAPEAVYQRAATGQGAGMDAVTAGRLNGLWIPLLPDARKHLVFGNGIGSVMWSDAMREGVGHGVLPVTHPHNAYLQAVLDMGLVGLVLLCAYFVHVWRRLRALARDRHVEPVLRGFFQGAAAALIAMLVSDITDSSLVPRPEQAFLWLAIGMMYGEYARRRAAVAPRVAQARAPPQFATARGPA